MDPVTIVTDDSDDDEIRIVSEGRVQHRIDRGFEAEQRKLEVIFFRPSVMHVTPRPGFFERGPVPRAPNPPIDYTISERLTFPSNDVNGDGYEEYTKPFSRLGLSNPMTDSSSRRGWDAVIASRRLTMKATSCLAPHYDPDLKWLTRSEVEQGLRLATWRPKVWVPFGVRLWSSPRETSGLKWDGDQRQQYHSHDWMILPCNTRPGSEDGDHWQLVIFSKKQKRIYFGDSFYIITSKMANNLAINLRHFLINNGIEDPGILQVATMFLPGQRGKWQCGYIVIESARAFVYEDGLTNWQESRLYTGIQGGKYKEIALLENIECWSRIGYRDHHDLLHTAASIM
ncbi:hypothetical protein GGS26DRAFT_127275 [Hypomontagnella submonticulosa]|nr:hypothetical protein GGS26DRAFT_127275 [Hypomontagnella submonticulosa]